MFALGIRYLNGFVAAAEPDNLERAEWPPHPGRVFMALAAAHFCSGADPVERAALLWLEGSERGEITAPQIAAPQASHRAVVGHFVPVNDRAIWKKDATNPDKKPPQPLQSCTGIMRERQPRVFARAWLDDDTVYLQWPDLDPPEAYRKALSNLCSKVTRIGHSSSLVQMWVAEAGELPEPTWVPDGERAIAHFRIAGPGTLQYLEHNYNHGPVEDYAALKVHETAPEEKLRKAARKRLREEYGNRPPPRQRPSLSLFHGYARPLHTTAAPTAPRTIFSPHFPVLQLRPIGGPYRALDLCATLRISSRWREAILSHSNGLSEPVRILLSGHRENGAPADTPHLAFLPLAFVGHEHADGHVLGMGLVLPAGLSCDERREAMRAIGAVRELRLGPLGVWKVDTAGAVHPLWNLRADAWTAHPEGSTHWSTVTPVVFDRHPKAKDKAKHLEECAVMITEASTRIGLPTPREVIVTQVSAHLGVPPSFEFPRLKRKDGSERCHTHAILVFDKPVCGPILIGAGRYRGYGVCRAMDTEAAMGMRRNDR